MVKYLLQIWNSKDLRNKILFALGIIIIYRLLAHVSVPGANVQALKAATTQNALLDIFSVLTGGSMDKFSIVLMGISPYINASIIIQLLTVVIPRFESLSKEGEHGRRKLNAYTRWLTLPLAFLQSYGMIVLLNAQSKIPIVENVGDFKVVIPIMLTISAGTLLLVWLGEQITERGIGNGVSLLIFVNIISNIPEMIGKALYLAQDNEAKLIPFILTVLITIILTTIVILVTEGARRIPITYAGRGVRAKSEQSFLPIRINQAGMIPIIFAVALVSFPGIIAQFMQNATTPWLRDFSTTLGTFFQPQTVTYFVTYFLLIIAFSYFYVSITFNPKEVAENIQKRGGYVPGIRPGTQTSDYLNNISNKLTLFGALFIAIIAIIPILLQYIFSSASLGSIPMLISGAGMIIIVGVVLELIRQINAQLAMHDYQKFY